MKKINIIIASLALLIATACTNDFEEINTNNNVPTENNPATLLPSIIFEPINPHMTLQTWFSDQIMHYYVRRNDNQIDGYDFVTGKDFYEDVWRTNYAAIWNANDMISAAEEEGLNAYVAAGKIMKAYYLAINTELWIDVPASQAGLGGDQISPAYDSQESIYTFVLSELEEANRLLNADASFIGGGDVLFNGDVQRWKKLANSLRLRYLLRLSNIASVDAATQINTIVSDPNTYPIITSNEDSGFYDFSGVFPDASSISQLVITSFTGISMSKRIQDVFEVYDDPRVDYFFVLPQNSEEFPGHEGVPNGLTREAAQGWNGDGEANTSVLTPRFVEDPALLNYTIISNSEVQFILAEAAMKGWISGGLSAEEYYNQGITSNFNQLGVEIPSDFFTVPEVAWNNSMEQLIDQKWFSFLFNNTLESWGEKKRTGLPALDIGPLASTITGGVFPTRVLYPELEQTINSENYQSASSNIGGDNITAPHWYQN